MREYGASPKPVDWPPEDHNLWVVGTRPAGIFDTPHAGSRWSDNSRAKCADGYGHWLVFLHQAGWLDETGAPGQRVTKQRVETYIEALEVSGYASFTQVCRIQELYDALRVMEPGQDWMWLRRILGQLECEARPVHDKRPRLRPAGQVNALGASLMAEAEASNSMTVIERARQFRDGLMIALLIHRPQRPRAFAAMTISKNVIPVGDRYWLAFGADTKTRRPVAQELPT